MIDEREDADDDIDYGKLLFTGSNKENLNFNIRKPLDFISAIYNGKISLKEAEIKMLKDVSKFIKKTESMAENINLSLFNEFFDSLPVDYAKYVINLKNTEENKEFVTEAKNRISALKVEIKKKKMSKNETKEKRR